MPQPRPVRALVRWPLLLLLGAALAGSGCIEAQDPNANGTFGSSSEDPAPDADDGQEGHEIYRHFPDDGADGTDPSDGGIGDDEAMVKDPAPLPSAPAGSTGPKGTTAPPSPPTGAAEGPEPSPTGSDDGPETSDLSDDGLADLVDAVVDGVLEEIVEGTGDTLQVPCVGLFGC